MGVVISSSIDTSSTANDNIDKNAHQKDPGKSKHFSERFMIWYAEQLMRPWVKVMVLLGFAGYTAFCSYRMTLLTQEFNVEDYTVSTNNAISSSINLLMLTPPVIPAY